MDAVTNSDQNGGIWERRLQHTATEQHQSKDAQYMRNPKTTTLEIVRSSLYPLLAHLVDHPTVGIRSYRPIVDNMIAALGKTMAIQ